MSETIVYFLPEWYCPNCNTVNYPHTEMEEDTCNCCGETFQLDFHYPEQEH